MEVFGRIAIGTANWGKPYGISGKKVSEQDQKDILDYCWCCGIDTIDTATAYDWDWTKIGSYFKVIVKIRTGDDLQKVIDSNPYCIMAHGTEHWDYMAGICKRRPDWYKIGISAYPDTSKLNGFLWDVGAEAIQLPYSIFDRRYEYWFPIAKEKNIEIHVRSVFLQGKILKKAKPHECIAFCLMNSCVDKVIIGIDNVEQLRENLDYFHWLNSLEVKDEKILDPRKWKEEK